MSYKYDGFISQNIAPKGAKNINVYDNNGNKIYTIPLGNLTPVNKTKLFSFGLISDLHLTAERTITSTHFDNALTYFEEQGCSFCCHAGDMTNIGFWYNRGDTEIYLGQFAEYKRICDLHPNLPVYGICGNHENYNAVITENLTELEEYTGHGLYFTVNQGNDLFIFIGQPTSYQAINLEELQWLEGVLEENKNMRCHIFVHVYPPSDSGNTKDCYPASFGSHWDTLKNLLNKYTNTILYHGHSHIKFNCQELDKTTNYTEKNGFSSLHVPSVAASRDVVLQADGTYKRVTDESSSMGYLVDVYDDCIVYNGIEFNSKKPIPTGIIKIDKPIF
jgi:predicted phosphodiesterase